MHCIGRKEELQSEPKSQGVHFLPTAIFPLALCQKQSSNQVTLSAISTFCFSVFPIGTQRSHDAEQLQKLTLHQIFHLPCEAPCQTLCHLSDTKSR